MSSVLKDHVAKRIEEALGCYVKDFEALDEVRLRHSLGGAARTPYDFSYEVVFVNRRIVQRLKGEVPEPWEPKGWITAPDGFKSRATAVRELVESTNQVLEAWRALPDSDLTKTFETPGGSSDMLSSASLCASHLLYHDAQLNYIQALDGDDEMHWD